jgi:hypothetical protein
MTSPIPALDPASLIPRQTQPALNTDPSTPDPAKSTSNPVLPVPSAEPCSLDPDSLAETPVLPVAAPARPIYDLELPVFEPASTTNTAPPALSPQAPEPAPPIRQSAWASKNPALTSPCHCEADPALIPHRPGKDQFHQSDPADCQCDHRADHLAVTARPESGPWPEPIGYAQALLVP